MDKSERQHCLFGLVDDHLYTLRHAHFSILPMPSLARKTSITLMNP